jgi:hypothetical protein
MEEKDHTRFIQHSTSRSFTMLNFTNAAAAIACCLALTGVARAAGPTGTAADFGSSAPASFAMRTIDIQPDTKWINVTNGETVQLNVNGHSVVWHFETFPNANSFDLAKIAPADFKDGAVRAYVASNPLYRG